MSKRRVSATGFTLVELLVVISIVTLLAGIVIANTFRARSVSRDNVRTTDISVIQNALGLYFTDNRVYPATTTGTLSLYLPVVPVDPLTGAPYPYAGIDTNGSAGSCEAYHLGASMENAGFAGLGQDRDAANAASVCAGSGADFHGNAVNCSGTSAASPDPCFDLSSP